MILEYKKKILEFEGKLKKPASEKGKNCLKLLFAIDKREYVEDIPPSPSFPYKCRRNWPNRSDRSIDRRSLEGSR